MTLFPPFFYRNRRRLELDRELFKQYVQPVLAEQLTESYNQVCDNLTKKNVVEKTLKQAERELRRKLEAEYKKMNAIISNTFNESVHIQDSEIKENIDAVIEQCIPEFKTILDLATITVN